MPEQERINLTKQSKRVQEKEFILWQNGTLSIDDWIYHFTGNDALAHAILTPSQARALRKFLNKPAVKQALGIVPCKPREAVAKQHMNLGQHQVEIKGQRVTLGNHRGQVQLDAGETYRLFTILREIFQ
jgi:hypothetical protein